MNGVNLLTIFSSMYGVMGIANAQRTLTYLQIITEFVSQDQYRDVVGMWVSPLFSGEMILTCSISVGIVNEILWGTIGQIPVQSFYHAAYEAIRKATYALRLFTSRSLRSHDDCYWLVRGTGTRAGPYIAIHDGFQGVGYFLRESGQSVTK